MHRRLACTFIAVLLVITICVSVCFAQNDLNKRLRESNQSGMTWKVEDDGTLIIDGSGDMDSYSKKSDIPWCNYAEQITAIEIGNGITSISDCAFYGLEKVIDIMIPDSVTHIGNYAFKNCTALKSVMLSMNLLSIGESAFYNCSSLEEIVIPPAVTTIGAYCFANDIALVNAMFEGEMPRMGENAFKNTGVQIQIPDGSEDFDDYPPLNSKALNSQAEHDWLTNQGRSQNRAIISFIDDDCRMEAYSILYDVIRKEQIPYTLACPPDSLNKKEYMTTDQLSEMVEYGVEIASHHLLQMNMEINNFKTMDDYEEELEECDQRFSDLGVSVETICYPQGAYMSEYLPAVKNHYRAGFTINRGINYAPYNTYTLKRCEVFPKDGSKTIEDAMRLVDEAVQNGGWLIFMTHAWYPSFQKNQLRELIQYIKKQDCDILGVHEALNKSGNIIEIGNTELEESERTEPFFVTSATGESRTNSLRIYESSSEKISTVTVKYSTKNVLKKTGGVVESRELARTVSLPTEVKEGEELYITGCAAWGNCVYVFYDEDGKVLKDSEGNPREDAYLASDSSGKDLIVVEQKITVPKGAKSIRVASCTAVQLSGFRIARVDKHDSAAASGLVLVKSDGTEVSITAEQMEKLLELIQ